MSHFVEGGFAVTFEELCALRESDPAIEDRVDIRSVSIDADAPFVERVEQYLSQIVNPYAFRYGDYAVNVRFNPEGRSLRDSIKSYLMMKKTAR
jgi:hypothetical protein